VRISDELSRREGRADDVASIRGLEPILGTITAKVDVGAGRIRGSWLASRLDHASIASGSAEGIEKAKSIHPVAVITDMMMPNVSGADLLRARKLRPVGAVLPPDAPLWLNQRRIDPLSTVPPPRQLILPFCR
jgi:CheY-like chemotaxis protein